jgi:hypothetical protein
MLAPGGDEWLATRPDCLTSGTILTGGFVGPRAGLDGVAKRKFPIRVANLAPIV